MRGNYNYESRKSSGLLGVVGLLGLGGIGLFFARKRFAQKSPEEISRSARDEFIDKCTARWLFEKTGVRLYDRILEKCPAEVRDRLQHFRNEEKEHEEMLEDVIRKYGADPHARTESARITDIESQGIVKVVEQEGYVAALDAMLAAELVDNANWDLLMKLARKIGDYEAAGKFSKALIQEAQHLHFIRKQVINETYELLEGHHREEQRVGLTAAQ